MSKIMFLAVHLTRIILISIVILISTTNAKSWLLKQEDSFTEELLIKPVSRGYIYSHFQFTTIWNTSIHDQKTFQHFNLFPKALGEVLDRYGVQELHLSQTQGLWRHNLWGYPIHDAPPGAQLWVWFKPSIEDVDSAWTDLVNAVSGLFCSSLNFLDSKNTISPRWSFRPSGLASSEYSVYSPFLRYGTLPREIVCTENLTPWKKLLPCDSKAGLATLFNAFKFHEANYHSLGLHVRPICVDDLCQKEGIELSQSLSLVTDVVSTNHRSSPNWSVRSLYGKDLLSACPVASKSTVMVDVTDSQVTKTLRLSPSPTSLESVRRGADSHSYAVYDVAALTANGQSFRLTGNYENSVEQKEQDPPPIYAHRYLTGYGLEKGGISCIITNTLDRNQSIIYMDILPWFTRIFFKTLKVQNNGLDVDFKVHFRPGKDRIRPYHLELSLMLWPHSVTHISFLFDRAFLKWTEYPPDANHGFYIGSSVITSMIDTSRQYSGPPLASARLSSILTDNSTSFLVRLHTEALVVSLPTPDFSMPYNVICLACTVIAIAFGSIHNLTTRRFVKLDPSKRKGLVSKVKDFLRKPKKEVSDTDSADLQIEKSDSSKPQEDVKEKSESIDNS